MRTRTTIPFLLLFSILAPSPAVRAMPGRDVNNDRVTFDFPETATFSATLTGPEKITSVVLEYGNLQQSCGEVIAKGFPEFAPSTSGAVEWTWDMRQSGSLPPGATIWWRWRYQDESGDSFLGEKQTATWLDEVHDWQSISQDGLRLHYYGKDPALAGSLLEAGLEGLRRNRDLAGLTPDGPIDIYIYPNYPDMQDAILFEPSWTGGQAYADFNIIIMGLSEEDDDWNRNTVIHELTHQLVGAFTFSCIGTLPGWIEEGLAMFSEGGLDSDMQSLLEDAIRRDDLITLRSLNGGFSELPDKANLSYSQSYSVIKFLIDTHGPEKMTRLLTALRDARPIDDALLEVYGVDTDGLDDAWRRSVGAPPRIIVQPTPQSTPTWVPTFVPIAGGSLLITPTPFVVPTSSFNESSSPISGPPLGLTLMLACLCLLILLIVGVFALGLIVRRQNAGKGRDVRA
ncbi:MAG: hypothetical protein FJZ87_16340 [Chloroflexi bacterium]|nr:hypothetical protein [Chloroflexota bacterium]